MGGSLRPASASLGRLDMSPPLPPPLNQESLVEIEEDESRQAKSRGDSSRSLLKM